MIKKVSYNYYSHKSNITELCSYLSDIQINKLNEFIAYISANYGTDSFHVIKFNTKNDSITLSQSINFDADNEPNVGCSYRIDGNNKITYQKSKGQIYHSKELFVADDYVGFDINKAKERTTLWNDLPDIRENKCKIGYKNFWEEYLKKYDIKL